ncbi:MAG: enoyl-CoA hydratase/isomerase family protein, partial [Pseudomonadota bacterium]
DQALALGLVDKVVGTGEGMAAAEVLAAQVIARSPRATELTKMLIAMADGEERDRVAEALAGALASGGPDLAEGLAAFRARRKPDFT